MKKHVPFLSIVVASGILVGCGGPAPLTDCLTQDEALTLAHNHNLELCSSNTRPCFGAINWINVTDVPSTAEVCAFTSPEAICGVVNENGCNRMGRVTYQRKEAQCDTGSSTSQIFCVEPISLIKLDSSCTPDGSGWVLCTDHENPGGSPN